MTCALGPTLTAASSLLVRRRRILPVPGEVLVEVGQEVGLLEVVAQALEPGALRPVNAAAVLGVAPREIGPLMRKRPGDAVREGEVLAERRALFGLFTSALRSPIDGTVETVSDISGQVMLRAAARSISLCAFLPGRVVSIIADRGVEIEGRAAIVQGIAGIGKEAFGPLVRVDERPGSPLVPERITAAHRGAVVFSGGWVSGAALHRLVEVGAAGLVAGSARGLDLLGFAGYDWNPACTGGEDSHLTVVLTEGFGEIPMADRVFALLSSLAGREVAVDGTTQVRAGAIRPEIVAAPLADIPSAMRQEGEATRARIAVGDRVRIVRGREFGAVGRVARIPEAPVVLATGASALAFEVALPGERIAVVPRPNVEFLGSD